MDFRAIGVIFWGFLLATAAVCGEEQHTRIEIRIDDDAAGRQSFTFDSQDAGFDLDSFVVGETRSVTDVSGNTADIRRTEEGFEIDVNGKTIDLMYPPEVDALHHEQGDQSHLGRKYSGVTVSEDVEKVKVVKIQEDHDESHRHDAHEIRIIEKEIDVTN